MENISEECQDVTRCRLWNRPQDAINNAEAQNGKNRKRAKFSVL